MRIYGTGQRHITRTATLQKNTAEAIHAGKGGLQEKPGGGHENQFASSFL
jgi:hypothetical protein